MRRVMTGSVCAIVILIAGCRKEPPLTRVETPQQAACLVPCDRKRDACLANAHADSAHDRYPTGPNQNECLEARLICALECGLRMKAQ